MNKLIPALLIALFLVTLALDCIFILNLADEYRVYTKPLLMPIIYALLTVQTAETTHKNSKLYIRMAIFFSFLGDFALLNDGDNFYFVIGLTSFLIAHIWYAMFFLRIKKFSKRRITTIALISTLILIYLFLVVNHIWAAVLSMSFEIPVIAYALVIGFMLLTAINTMNARRIKKVAFQNFIPGAVLFIVSDSLIAINKFAVTPNKSLPLPTNLMYSVIIMITYGLAQLAIITGAIRIIKK